MPTACVIIIIIILMSTTEVNSTEPVSNVRPTTVLWSLRFLILS